MIEKEVSEYIDRSGLGRRQFLWYGGVAGMGAFASGLGPFPSARAFPRMIDLARKRHALVIGIGSYKNKCRDADLTLPYPADEASKFVTWLVEKGASPRPTSFY